LKKIDLLKEILEESIWCNDGFSVTEDLQDEELSYITACCIDSIVEECYLGPISQNLESVRILYDTSVDDEKISKFNLDDYEDKCELRDLLWDGIDCRKYNRKYNLDDIDKAINLLIDSGFCYKVKNVPQIFTMEKGAGDKILPSKAICPNCSNKYTYFLPEIGWEMECYDAIENYQDWSRVPRECFECRHQWTPNGSKIDVASFIGVSVSEDIINQAKITCKEQRYVLDNFYCIEITQEGDDDFWDSLKNDCIEIEVEYEDTHPLSSWDF
jgi:hypothetical protein